MTAEVTSAQGWKRRLAAGGTCSFKIRVTPNSGVTSGNYEALVRAESQHDPTQRDTLKAVTRVK